MSYFKISEFDCKCGCGSNKTKTELLELLNKAREIAGIPFIINSGTRCERHNHDIGGSMLSSHIDGYAADIKCENSSHRFIMIKALLAAGFCRIEWGTNTWLHVDCDPRKPQNIIFNP